MSGQWESQPAAGKRKDFESCLARVHQLSASLKALQACNDKAWFDCLQIEHPSPTDVLWYQTHH